MNRGKHTFICYARQDKEFARKLANDLRKTGVGIWMDVLDIPAGVRWDDAVEEALGVAERLLVVLSPQSAGSKNVKDELNFALEEEMPIVPVLLQPCKIPFRIRRLQHLNFTNDNDYDTALQELFASLGVQPVAHHPKAGEIERLFAEAQAALAKENWPAAIGSLKAVLALDANHAQAKDALQQAEFEEELAAIYTRAHWHFKNQRWTEAKRTFLKLLEMRNEYKDARFMLSQIEREFVKAKKRDVKKSVPAKKKPVTEIGQKTNFPPKQMTLSAKAIWWKQGSVWIPSVIVTFAIMVFVVSQFQAQSDGMKLTDLKSNEPVEVEELLDSDDLDAFALQMDSAIVLIPASEFLMGSDYGDENEKPVHRVKLDAFYMDKYEVTVAQYKRFLYATSNYEKPANWDEQMQDPRRPVVNVSWHDASAYAKWVDKRLPTEAEWEYAARGGFAGLNGEPRYEYPWGNDINDIYSTQANFGGAWSSDWHTGPDKYLKVIGSSNANNFGLYDMAGNVREWCADWYTEDYYKQFAYRTVENPIGPENGSYRVVRGGSWVNDPVKSLRISYRFGSIPSGSLNYLGFRCVQEVTL